MLWRRRGGRRRALLQLRRGVSDVGAASGRVEPNGNSVLPRRGTGPHHTVVFVIRASWSKRTTVWLEPARQSPLQFSNP